MKHPVRDRIWILLCALCALCAAAAAAALAAGRLTLEPAVLLMQKLGENMAVRQQIVLGVAAAVLVVIALRLIWITLPSKKKRSSNFAIQQNEEGAVRISIKALDALVQRCLNQHAELKVVTSSLHSDEESVRVDVHITLQSDISMPLAVSALQKQIKRYLEACSGVAVKEVRVFVDGMMPPSEESEKSPYAIPESLLGLHADALPGAQDQASEPLLIEVDEVPAKAVTVEAAESTAEETVEAEPETPDEPEQETKEEGEQA